MNGSAMITIQPQYLPLSKLLDGRLFRIPEYQRAYSWTGRERRDLFNDICKAHEKKESHYLAAVVCLRRQTETLGTDEFQVMEVVDGQQRLTTLVILLNALKLALNKNEAKEAKLAGELGELLVKVEGNELLLLQTNHDSSHHFSDYLRMGTAASSASASTTSDRQILEAIENCAEFVATWMSVNGNLLSLAALLKNRLFVLLHEIDDEKTVYTVFEVLNSRGLTVSWFDRLKSILMGAVFEIENANRQGVINDLHTIWRDIYNVLGLRLGLSTEVLRFAATLRHSSAQSRPLGEKDAVEVLRAQAGKASEIRGVASWLLDVTKASNLVVGDTRINAVTQISQARLLAVAINLRSDLKPSERSRLLDKWEKVSFRIYGLLRRDARTRVGEFVRLAWRVVNEKPNVEEIVSKIGAIGREFSIDDAIGNLRGENCYEGWETELRYMMFRYEEHLAKDQKQNFSNAEWEKIWRGIPSASIEHIWAQSMAPSSEAHRIGNLMLLPLNLNKKLKDKTAKDKADSYEKTGLLIAQDVAAKIRNQGWNQKAVDQREEEILTWAKMEWGD